MVAAEAPVEQHARTPEPMRGMATVQAADGLTPIRRAVLGVVKAARAPLGAYEVMTQLAGALGRPVAPPTVYRSLDYLCRIGLVVRLESKNAFVARRNPQAPPADAYFICGQCGVAEEATNPSLGSVIDHSAVALGFRIERRVVEMAGTCARCQTTAAPEKASLR
jgi:Fur family zinc uptake transcriptional regulator